MERDFLACVILASAGLAIAACARPDQDGQSAPPVRPRCLPIEATIYLKRYSADLAPSATRVLQQVIVDIMDCQQAGGALERIGIDAYPDRDSTCHAGQEQIRARASAVQR